MCARAGEGKSEARVMWVHVLRNAVDSDHHQRDDPAAGLLAGAFLIERFFSIRESGGK